MRCIWCGAEMRPIQVLRDVAGCECRTLECVGCADIERAFVFRRTSEPAEPRPICITIPVREVRIWARVFACLRRGLAPT